MGKTHSKKPCLFRLSPGSLRELKSLSHASGLDKTAIVELGIMRVRPHVLEMMEARSAALKTLPPPDETES